MSKSYPFLAIANRFNVPYEAVLIMADYSRANRHDMTDIERTNYINNIAPHREWLTILDEIETANKRMTDIQSGKRDWNA